MGIAPVRSSMWGSSFRGNHRMTHPLVRVASLTACMAIAPFASAQSWHAIAPTASPPARLGAAAATDLGTGQVVLFGGQAGSSYLNDTWRFDGATWTASTGTSPAVRMRAAMAYDASHAAVVMFGGVNGVSVNSILQDTWRYANGAWSQAATGFPVPPRRFGHAMASDSARQRVVMFGGRTNAGTIYLQDTWEWDGATWTPLSPAHMPTNRMGHAMAFDPVLGQVVLFGGLQLGGPFQNDTWTWNGVDWTQLAPAMAPSARGDHAMATDAARGRVVLFGGYDGGDLVDTWEWTGATWATIAGLTSPGVHALAPLATGPTGRHVVLFGGMDASGGALGDTWHYGQLAATHSIGAGCGVPPLTLAPTGGSLPVLGQTFAATITAPAGALPFVSLGMNQVAVDLAFAGMPNCMLYHDLTVLGLGCTPSGSEWTTSVALPNQPAFVGVEIYAQGYALAIGANPLGLITSNGLGLLLGMP